MAITKDASAPLVVVVGSTGNQGGSVIKALSESDRPYRIRGLTRDASKSSATALKEQGVQVVGVTLTVDNRAQAFKAFETASYAFVSGPGWRPRLFEGKTN